MAHIRREPGPAANRAFTLGLVAALVTGGAVIGLLFWSDTLDVVGVVLAVVLGLPIVGVLASCVLSIWLGYDYRNLGAQERV
jgi:hypothetical protein